MNTLQGEPTLGQIDDYNGNETPEKRRLVWGVVIGLIAVAIIYAMVKSSFSTPNDYVGTEEHPGILNSRK